MIERVRHQHSRALARRGRFLECRQRDEEQSLARPGDRHQVAIGIDHRRRQMEPLVEPIRGGTPELRRADRQRIATPVGQVLDQGPLDHLGRRRLRLADREQKGTLMPRFDPLQQHVEPGEGVELEQRIEAVGHRRVGVRPNG